MSEFYFEDDDTGQRAAWRSNTEVRLQRVEEVVTALKGLKWAISLLVALGIALAGWSVRTTLVTEVRLDAVERSVVELDELGSDISALKTEIGYLRRDLERIRQ